MNAIRDSSGTVVGWILQNVVIDLDGNPIAILSGDQVVKFSGEQVATFNDGYFRRPDGYVIAFVSGARHGPALPGLRAEPPYPQVKATPVFPVVPVAYLHEPYRRQWSVTRFARLFSD